MLTAAAQALYIKRCRSGLDACNVLKPLIPRITMGSSNNHNLFNERLASRSDTLKQTTLTFDTKLRQM